MEAQISSPGLGRDAGSSREQQRYKAFRVSFRSLVWGSGSVLIGYDNDKPKGYHVHVGDTECAYAFRDVGTLIDDLVQRRRTGIRIDASPRRGYGMQSRIAAAIRRQTPYLSAILKGAAQLSPEQADLFAQFAALTDTERHYFLLLVQFERAGTASLKHYYEQQMEQAQRAALDMKARFSKGPIVERKVQEEYYSSWCYAAAHVLLTIDEYQTFEALAAKLKLTRQKLHQVMALLVDAGFATLEKGRYRPRVTRMHMGNDAADIAKHHANWRLQALTNLQQDVRQEDLHSSSVITASAEDQVRIGCRRRM